MQQFLQTLVSGLALGSIYGSLALALVLIYKATEVINFAQGEMAMFTTYIAWALMEHHGHLLLARVRAHARDRVLLRRGPLRRRRQAARARERADRRDGDDRAARDPERARLVDLVAAAAVLPEPVPDHLVGDRRGAHLEG